MFLLHQLQVRAERLLHALFHLFPCVSHSNAPRNVRRISPPRGWPFFNDYQDFSHCASLFLAVLAEIPLRCSLAAIDLVISQRTPDSLYQPWERAQTCPDTYFHVPMPFLSKRAVHGSHLPAMHGLS